MVVTKTEWLSLRLHSEEIYNLVSKLNLVDQGIWSESQLALDLESEVICMRTLIQQLRGQICMAPEVQRNIQELHS